MFFFLMKESWCVRKIFSRFSFVQFMGLSIFWNELAIVSFWIKIKNLEVFSWKSLCQTSKADFEIELTSERVTLNKAWFVFILKVIVCIFRDHELSALTWMVRIVTYWSIRRSIGQIRSPLISQQIVFTSLTVNWIISILWITMEVVRFFFYLADYLRSCMGF